MNKIHFYYIQQRLLIKNRRVIVGSVPARDFGGELAEQVGRGSGAAVRRQRGIVAERGRGGRRPVSGRHALPNLPAVERAAYGGTSSQPTPICRGRGGRRSCSGNTESGGRGGGETVGERAAQRDTEISLYSVLLFTLFTSYKISTMHHAKIMCVCVFYLFSLPFWSRDCLSVLGRSVHTYVFLRVIALPGMLFYQTHTLQSNSRC